MLITDELLRGIVSGEIRYVSCDYCGKHSTIVGPDSFDVANELCPNCKTACCEAGEGWGVGFYGVVGRR